MKKTILITGISSGIGKYLTTMLKDHYRVIGVSRRNPDIEGVEWIRADLSTGEEIDLVSDFFGKTHPSLPLPKGGNSFNDRTGYTTQIDIVIHNAGVGYFGEYSTMEAEKLIEMLQTNLLAPVLLTQKLLPFLKTDGKIIFIGSRAGRKFMRHGAGYQASKFGLRGLAGALSQELSQVVHLINPKIVPGTGFFGDSGAVFAGHGQTSPEDIFTVIQNILSGSEQRFEIDI